MIAYLVDLSVFRPTGASTGDVGFMAFMMIFFSLALLRYASTVILNNDELKKEAPMEIEPNKDIRMLISAGLESIWAIGIGIIAGHLLT